MLCIVLSIMVILLKKETKGLARQLTDTGVLLDQTTKQIDEIRARQAEMNAFHNNLQTAELTTRLQKPRLEAQHSVVQSPLAGKYSNIQALADQDMSIEDIAATLAVSTHEAQQLVNLSRIAQGNFTGNVADRELRKQTGNR